MRIFFVIAPVFVLFAPFCSAQNVMQLSLKRAVDIALTPEGSARVALAEESIRASETHVSAARAAFYPTVDGSVNGIQIPSIFDRLTKAPGKRL